MSGLIMFFLIIGVIYIALTYLKGPRNTDTDRNNFYMGPSGSNAWNAEDLPELPDNDVTETEADGEDMEEIGFEADEEESVQESGAQAMELAGEPAVLQPMGTTSQDAHAEEFAEVRSAPAVPEAILPVIPPADGVVIDSEVRIDAVMPSDNNK